MLRALALPLLAAFAALSAFGADPGAPALTPVPPFPPYYVLDEPGLLNASQRKALETLLIEHDQATGELFAVAILKHGTPESPRALLQAWFNDRGRTNGALVAYVADPRVLRIEAAYRLESLDEANERTVIRDFIEPELRAGHPFRAFGLGTLELLRAAGSPLITSGRAQQLLQQGGLEGPLRPESRAWIGPAAWWAFVGVGALLFAAMLHGFIAAEAHFTGQGWFRPRPWQAWIQTLRERTQRRGGDVADVSGLGGIDGQW